MVLDAFKSQLSWGPVADHERDYDSRPQNRFRLVRAVISLLVIVCSVQALTRIWTADSYTKPLMNTDSLTAQSSDFDWLSISPSDNIIWTPCYSGHQCARLLLLLDYLSPVAVTPNVTIALRMIPATDKENYKGTILVNPGGPGGSGTAFVGTTGANISRIVGRSYDILGFDPRGVGASTPSSACFGSEAQLRVWLLSAAHILPNLTDDSINLVRSRERAAAQVCAKALNGTGEEEAGGTAEDWGIGRFMSTASVATDMLRITEKLGQDKLLYWGFSYGTILGQYFAAMYPDKVGRMVIDGVCDANKYRSSIWNTNLVDYHRIVDSFYAFCHQAGPEKCTLYEPSVAAIRARVEAIFKAVEDEPVEVPFTDYGPTVLTKRTLYELTFIISYKPIVFFPYLADLLVAAERKNQTALATLVHKELPGFKCDCKQTPFWEATNSAFMAVGCGDGDPVEYNPETHRQNFAAMYETAPTAAPFWDWHHLRCTEWRVRPKWRYTGPLAAADTAHPMLLISPLYDTVCPLSHAQDVHTRYAGSALLVQDSYGHCSTSAPSLCTAKYLQAYFENGTLPEEGSVCKPDELPFVGMANETRASMMSVEDNELLDAIRGLGEGIATFGA